MDNAINKVVGANIRYIREKLGMHQEDLAKKLGVKQSSISRWENCECVIPAMAVYHISIELEIGINFFFVAHEKDYICSGVESEGLRSSKGQV